MMYSIVDTKVHEYLAYCFNVVQELESQIEIKTILPWISSPSPWSYHLTQLAMIVYGPYTIEVQMKSLPTQLNMKWIVDKSRILHHHFE